MIPEMDMETMDDTKYLNDRIRHLSHQGDQIPVSFRQGNPEKLVGIVPLDVVWME